MVTKVVVVAERVRPNTDSAEVETRPSGPGPLCPLFDLVATRHDYGGLVPMENPSERTRFRVVARRTRGAETGERSTPPRPPGERALARAG